MAVNRYHQALHHREREGGRGREGERERRREGGRRVREDVVSAKAFMHIWFSFTIMVPVAGFRCEK